MAYVRSKRGSFPSLKMDQMIKFQSLIEHDLMYWLEYDPAVKSYEAQSVTIKYKVRDEKKQKWKPRQYTPDFYVVTSDHSHFLIECKAKRFVDSATNQHKFAVAREWCSERNWEFMVLTEEDIRQLPRFDNIKFLWRYARFQENPELLNHAYEILYGTKHTMTLAELATELNPQDPILALPPIYYLVFHHKLYIPIDELKISKNSPIFLPQKKGESYALSFSTK